MNRCGINCIFFLQGMGLPKQFLITLQKDKSEHHNKHIGQKMSHAIFTVLVEEHLKSNKPDFYFAPKWKVLEPLSLGQKTGKCVEGKEEKQNVVIMYSKHGHAVAGILKECHSKDNVIEIELGTEQKKNSENNWSVKAGSSVQIENVVSNLKNIHKIFFLGGILPLEFDINNIDFFKQTQEEGIISLFQTVKALSKYNSQQNPITIKIFTNNVHQIIPQDTVVPFSGVFSGFVGSMAKEFWKWKINLLDIDLNEFEDMPKNQIHGFIEGINKNKKYPVEISLRRNLIYKREVDRLELTVSDKLAFQQKGVYMIIGGAGGIGLEMGLLLAKTIQARLVLIGRSELNDDQIKKIAEMEAVGGEVLYQRADVCKEEEMQQAVKIAKSHFGQIQGVVHSAVVTRDNLIVNMDENGLRSALAPKVLGSVILNKVLEGEQLDFMIYFSSVQGLVGSPGVSNYSGGCSFEDSFASYLVQIKNYPVKVINWGFWSGVGVGSPEDLRKRMAAVGVESISTKEGMEAFNTILLSPVNQLVVMKASDKVLLGIGFEVLTSEKIDI